MNLNQVPDIMRHDKDDQGRPVLWIGTVRVVPIFEVGTAGYVISRSDLADAVRAAFQIGWNAKTKATVELLTKAAQEIGQ